MKKVLIFLFVFIMIFNFVSCVSDNEEKTIYDVGNQYFIPATYDKYRLTSIGVNGHQGAGTTYHIDINTKCSVTLNWFSAEIKLYSEQGELLDSFKEKVETSKYANFEITISKEISYETYSNLNKVKVVWCGQSYDKPIEKYNELDENDKSDEQLKLKQIATLNKDDIFKYYSNGSTIHTEENGITIMLDKENSATGFIWDLSNYTFNQYSTYYVVFENLRFSDFLLEDHKYISAKFRWQDSSFKYLKYYDANTKTFEFESSDYDYVFIKSLSNDTYMIEFNFEHAGVNRAENKSFYFDFRNIEKGGSMSFDKVSIYEKN